MCLRRIAIYVGRVEMAVVAVMDAIAVPVQELFSVGLTECRQ